MNCPFFVFLQTDTLISQKASGSTAPENRGSHTAWVNLGRFPSGQAQSPRWFALTLRQWLPVLQCGLGKAVAVGDRSPA